MKPQEEPVRRAARRPLREAIAELKGLPTDAWERDVALPPWVQLHMTLPEAVKRTDKVWTTLSFGLRRELRS